ncbi:T9SS type A sorting domain-containing protein, partial [bacterium]|nr:T9SS type A sorting domain-containing protein [bacterium]
GQVHADGEIIGAAMWHSREELGAVYSDSLFHYTRYNLANNFNSYFEEVLVNDDDDGDLSNGTPNSDVLYEQFGRHGIGPGDQPNLVFNSLEFEDGNGDGFMQPGETVTVSFELHNDVWLYPPAAQNVTMSGAEMAEITWNTSEVVIGEIGPDEVVTLDDALSFTVNSSTPLTYADLEFTLEANSGEFEHTEIRTVVFGETNIVLIDDATESGRQARYLSALQNLGVVAYPMRTDNGAVVQNNLDRFDIVIWFTGNVEAPISSLDESLLLTHINEGGGLILTGQHVGPQLNTTMSDLAATLGVASTSTVSNEVLLMGVDGHPFSGGHTIAINGVGGMYVQNLPYTIVHEGSVEPIYTFYRNGETGAIWNPDVGMGAALFGFGLEGVSGASTTTPVEEVLRPILEHYGVQTGVEDQVGPSELPSAFALSTPYPNPFNPTTRVHFDMAHGAEVRLAVYNALGREVMSLVNGWRDAGRHEVNVDLSEFAAGMYFMRLDTPNGAFVTKALLLK